MFYSLNSGRCCRLTTTALTPEKLVTSPGSKTTAGTPRSTFSKLHALPEPALSPSRTAIDAAPRVFRLRNPKMHLFPNDVPRRWVPRQYWPRYGGLSAVVDGKTPKKLVICTYSSSCRRPLRVLSVEADLRNSLTLMSYCRLRCMESAWYTRKKVAFPSMTATVSFSEKYCIYTQ